MIKKTAKATWGDTEFWDAVRAVLPSGDWAPIAIWLNRTPRAHASQAEYGELARCLRTAAQDPRMPAELARMAAGVARSAQYVADNAQEEDLR